MHPHTYTHIQSTSGPPCTHTCDELLRHISNTVSIFLHQLAKNTEQFRTSHTFDRTTQGEASKLQQESKELIAWLRLSALLQNPRRPCFYLLGMEALGELFIMNTLKLGFGLYATLAFNFLFDFVSPKYLP